MKQRPPKQSPLKQSLRPSLAKLLLAASVAVILVAGAEIAARLVLGKRFVSGSFMGIPQYAVGAFDPELGWVNKPGASTWVVAERFAYTARINSKGLRDRKHPYEPPPGVVRIALLGDSVAWGWGVDDGQSLGDRLEERLQPQAEVVNLAVPGYSTDQALWMLQREGHRYQPDIVLLCFVMNDVVGNTSSQAPGSELIKPRYERDGAGEWILVNRPVADPGTTRERGQPLPLLARLHSRSGLLQLLRPFAANGPLDTGTVLAAPSDPEKSADEIAKLRRLLDKHHERIDALCDELGDPSSVHVMLLRRLKAECDAIGAELVVMPVPHHHDHYLYNPAIPLPPELEAEDGASGDPFRSRLTRKLQRLGLAIGFPVIVVDQAMLAAARRRELLQVPDGHLNERGNALVAEVAAESLRPLVERLSP